MKDKDGKEISMDHSLDHLGLEMKEELSRKAIDYADNIKLVNTNTSKTIRLTRVTFFLEVDGEPIYVSKVVNDG